MPALAEITPLRAESIDTIRARIDGNVNAGLDTADLRWQDATPGGWFWDHTQTLGFEAEELWNFGSIEVPAAVLLPWSFGIWLDYWGEFLGVSRKGEVHATGIVTLENTIGMDVLAAEGVQVAAPAVVPGDEPMIYATTASVNVPAGDSVDVPVIAGEAGVAYNVAPGTINVVESPLPGITVTNAAAVRNGAEVELDEPYKVRLLLEFSAARGGGSEDDLLAEALARPEVGYAVVERTWAGPGTTRIVVTDQQNEPLTGPSLASVQAWFAAHGSVEVVLTIATTGEVDVDVAATIQPAPGFTLDGDGGTEAIRDRLEQAVRDYIDALAPGEDVLSNRILALLMGQVGVLNVSSGTLLLNGTAEGTDVAVGPLQSARPDTITFAEAP